MIKVIFTLFLMVTLTPSYIKGEEVSDEHILSMLDNSQHLPQKFLAIVDDIHAYKPDYSKEEIVDLIITAYGSLKVHNVEISIYEVAEGIKVFAKDVVGIDLRNLVQAYINSRLIKQSEKKGKKL